MVCSVSSMVKFGIYSVVSRLFVLNSVMVSVVMWCVLIWLSYRYDGMVVRLNVLSLMKK